MEEEVERVRKEYEERQRKKKEKEDGAKSKSKDDEEEKKKEKETEGGDKKDDGMNADGAKDEKVPRLPQLFPEVLIRIH